MFKLLTADTYKDVIASTDEGTLIIFKELCPHCKNMEKVLEKFKAQRPAIALLSADSEKDSVIMDDLGAERVPTIFVIKGGKVTGKKAGLMNPREMAAFFDASK